MTYRERREAKAERLRGWAEAREAKQPALSEAARGDEAATGIPFGQPILVGHHSERRHRRAIERMDSAMRASVENGRKAEAMRSRADSIEAQAANAIYSDDHDAADRLREKIAGLEAQREQIKRYNASCRKAAKAGESIGDLTLLDAELKADILTTARACAYMLGKGGAFPAYKLTNLGATIRTAQKRLDDIESGAAARRAAAGRIITARRGGTCEECGATIERGDTIRYSRADGARCAPECSTTEEE